MFVLHFLLSIIYIALPIIFIFYYRHYRIENKHDKKFFLYGFLTKIFGSISAVLIYTLYYKGGDTTYYFETGKRISEYILEFPEYIPTVFLSDNLRKYSEMNFLVFKKSIVYHSDTSSYTISKISIILNILTFSSFFLSSILCSYFSFFCSWKFYKLITRISTVSRNYIGYAIFFMPSAIFWGSGLFKDTFTMAGLYLFIISLVEMFGYKRFKFAYLLYLIIGFYLLINIRSFFLLSAFPFIAIWILYLNYNKIGSPAIRFFLIPVFIAIVVGSTFFIFQSLTSTFKELSLENLADKSKGFQSWHTTLKGSSYSLGEIEYTVSGIVSKLPASIAVTFFRPYIWEANKPIIILSAIQSLAFTLITIYIILKLKIIYFFSNLIKSPPAIALMGFSLFYAFVVGFTSYNFGALDRYKIPCLSTYIIALIFIYEGYKLKNNER